MSRYLLISVVFATASLALAGCAESTDRDAQIRAPVATVIGDAESCISTSRIRTSRVHDDYTIDFEMIDGKVFRNTLPSRCPGLGFEERFGYRTTIGQLCSTDTITVLNTGSGVPGPTCGLGQFVPVEIAK